MHDLSPILYSMPSYKAFLNALYSANHAATAKSQADALAPIWQAIEKSAPNCEKLNQRALHNMFTGIAQHLNVVQLQRPIIAPHNNMLGAYLKMVMNKSMPDDMAATTKINTYGDFGTATLMPNRKYKFSFMTAVEDRSKLTAIPLIMLDEEILNSTLENDGYDLLSTFQDLSDITNHDYIHVSTAPLIQAYFGEAAIRMEETPYATANDGTFPLYSKLRQLYPSNVSNWQKNPQSPLALDAYEINFPLEGHALLTHKALFKNYMDQSTTALLVDKYFDQLTTLMTKLDDNNASEIGQYYTLLLYHRMLHMLPHQHPVMQHIEQRGAALAIDEVAWKTTFTNLTNLNTTTNESRRESLTLLPFHLRCFGKLHGSGEVSEQPTTHVIRMTAHANGMRYWIPLHYDQHKDAKRALPDMHRVFKTTAKEMTLAKSTLTLA